MGCPILNLHRYKGQYKYSVDCDKIKTDPTTLQVLDGSVRAKHTIVVNENVISLLREIHVERCEKSVHYYTCFYDLIYLVNI